MKKLLLWIWLLMKRQIKNPAVILFLIGMPVIAIVIANIPAMTKAESPRVGIVASRQDDLSDRVLSQLLNGDYAVDFYQALDYEQLKEDVRMGKTECGYILDGKLTDRYQKKDYAESILQIKNKSDFVPSMAREIVFSAVFSVYAKDMATEYVRVSPLFDKDKERAMNLVSNKYDNYLSGTATFYMKFSRLDASESIDVAAITDEAVTFPLKGILAILVYLAGLFGCVQWKMDEEKGVFLTLPYGFRIASRPIYAMIPTVLFAVSAELTMIFAGGAGNLSAEIWKMPLYVVAVILFSWGLNIILPSSKAVVSVIPVLLIASMVLCPIFVNVLTSVPAAKYLARLLLPYYYLS